MELISIEALFICSNMDLGEALAFLLLERVLPTLIPFLKLDQIEISRVN